MTYRSVGAPPIALAIVLLTVGVTACRASSIPTGRCVFNDDCPMGQICASRYCRAECRTDLDCTNRWRCVPSDQPDRRVCADPTDRPLCVYATDCREQDAGAGALCRSGHCVIECLRDYDCQVQNPNTTCDLAMGSATFQTCVARTAPPVDGGCADGGTACRGTCVDLGTDVRNCGRCGGDCTRLAGVLADRVRCVAGECDFASACQPGRAHCSTISSDGCEADLSTAATCGSCTNRCAAPRPFCTASTGDAGATHECVASCVPPRTLCADACVDTQTDRAHCGRCGTVCPDGAFATSACDAGRCVLRCAARRADCNGMAADGCEADLDADPTHCGACATACPARANAAATCTVGACGMRCNAGFASCDGDDTNGCEAQLGTSTVHCGTCGNACAARPNVTAQCIAGACAWPCAAGFADCDANAMNGCEVAVDADVNHCGACGRTCRSVNGSSRCAMGACSLVSCNAGFADCNADATDGCETTLATDVSHCGSCAARCPSVANAATSCTAGACGFTCLPGFVRVGAACLAPGPRLLSPLSGSIAMSNRPSFRFAPAVVATETFVQVCRDRACATVVASQAIPTPGAAWPVATAPGSRVPALAPGTYFWRAVGRDVGGAAVTSPSASWEFSVRAMPVGVSSVRDTFVGSTDDYNGDGFADVAAAFNDRADAYVYYGSAGGLPSTFSVRVPRGSTIVGATDVNGDGFSDLVVSDRLSVEAGCTGTGRVWVFHGGATGLAVTVSAMLCPPAAGISFGIVGAPLGDFNGDGYGDVVIGQCGLGGTAGAGAACVFLGSATGLVSRPSVIASPPGVIAFGSAVGGPYDIDGDQISDLSIGACFPGFDGCSSAAFTFHGVAGGIPTTFARRLEQPDVCDQFGRHARGAGDVNGDGYGDVIVGCNPNLATTLAFVYHGGPSGIPASPDTRLSPIGNTYAGESLRGLGDIDGDGFGDVAIAQTVFPPTLALWRGSLAGVPAARSTFVQGMTLTGFGYAVGPARDVDADGRLEFFAGCNSIGRVVQLQWDSGMSALTLGTQLLPPRAGGGWGESIAWLGAPRQRGRGQVWF